MVVLALLLALLLVRGGKPQGAAAWLATLLPVLAALELATGPIAAALPPAVISVLAVMGTPNLALIWLFGHALLIDGFQPRPVHWLIALLFWLGPVLVWAGLQRGLWGWFTGVLPFAVLGHLVLVALAGLADDLVPGRRQARLLLPAMLIATALVSALSELLNDPERADLLRAGLSGLPGLLVLAAWLLRADPLALAFPAATPAVPAPRLDPRDADLAARLASAMTKEQLWRREGLSIDQLAGHLGTPAHRLRTVINAGLGHRNFAAYVNGFRVGAAQAALADPARGRDTILAIAYESGFASLATFNRVFRDATGQTPSDYRDAALAARAQ